MAHKFDAANRHKLHDPQRRQWQNPDAILPALGLEEGMTVADVGCGTGFFALPAARLVGTTGRVYAIDMQEEMLWTLMERIREAGATNVLPVLSLEDLIPLPTAHLDLAVLVNALHEVRGDGALQEVHRILRPTGYFGVVDWKKEPMERGPPVDHRLSLEEAKERLRGCGFQASEVGVGPFHYGLRATKVAVNQNG